MVVGIGAAVTYAVTNHDSKPKPIPSWEVGAVIDPAHKLEVNLILNTVGGSNKTWANTLTITNGQRYAAVLVIVKNLSSKNTLHAPTALVAVPSSLGTLIRNGGTYIDSAGSQPVSPASIIKGGQNLPDLSPETEVFLKYRMLLKPAPKCGVEVAQSVQAVVSSKDTQPVRSAPANVQQLGNC